MSTIPDATREVVLPLRARILHGMALYAGAMSIYFASGLVARPPLVRLATPLDDAVPFVPLAMVGYALAYVVPISLLWVAVTAEGVRLMTRAVLLAYVMAAPFFIVMPVQDADPPLDPVTWAEQLLEWNRLADTSKNAFPSMHVGLAVLLALIAWRRSRAWGVALSIAAAVIAVSTLLVKQHFVVDIAAGPVVAWLAFRAIYRAPASASS